MPETLRKRALTVPFLREVYRSGALGPEQIADKILARIGPDNDDRRRTWLHLDEQAVRKAALSLEKQRATAASLPLYGVPFAVKDNIDVAGVPTTAGCPALSRIAEAHSGVV